MNKSTKATLLSVLVFPGVGHLYLKHYVPGVLLTGGAALASYVMIAGVMRRALDLVETIQNSGLPADVSAIVQLVSQHPDTGDGSIRVAMIVLSVFWVVGVFDSFRVGRRLEQSGKTGSRRQN